MFKTDVFLINSVCCPRFEFSPEMAFAVEIRQHKAFGFMANRKGNVRQALFDRRRTRCRFRSSFSFATL
jgi:hypothetical protein